MAHDGVSNFASQPGNKDTLKVVDKSRLVDAGIRTNDFLDKKSGVFDLQTELPESPYWNDDLIHRIFELQRNRCPKFKVEGNSLVDEVNLSRKWGCSRERQT